MGDPNTFYTGLTFVGFTGTIDQCLDLCDGLSNPRFRGVGAFPLSTLDPYLEGEVCGCLYDKDFVPPCPASGSVSHWAGHLYSECRQGGPRGLGSGPIATIDDDELGCYNATLAKGKSGKTGGESSNLNFEDCSLLTALTKQLFAPTGSSGDGGYYGGHSSKSSKGYGSATFTEVKDEKDESGACKGTSSSDNTMDSQYNSLEFSKFTGDLAACQHKCAAIGGMGFRGIEFDNDDDKNWKM